MVEDGIYRVLLQFGLFAIVVESALKAVFATKAYQKYILTGFIGEYISKPMFSIIVSVILCWRSRFDVLAKLVESEVTNIGIILTALAVSRGSNGISDFLNRRKMLKEAIVKSEVEQIKNGNGKPKDK